MPGKLIVDEIEDSGGTSVIGRKNYIINGNFDIWQRGTSFSWTGSSYSVDRWRSRSGGGTIATTRTAFTVGQTDVPNNPKYYTDITITGSPTNSYFEQRIENVYTLAGETITVSFYAKYTTNAPTDFKVNIIQNFGSGGSSSVTTAAASASTLTTSWQKFTVTISVPSISGKTVGAGSYLTLRFQEDAATTFDAQIAQVQVEKGSAATDFEVRPIAEELSLCQRYYFKTFAPETTPAQNVANDNYILVTGYTGGGTVSSSIQHPVQMASSPTITTFNPYAANASARELNSSNDRAITLVSVNRNKVYFFWSSINITNQSVHLHWTGDAEL